MRSTRWIVYQRERFPLAVHAPLIAAFSLSAVSVAALLRGADVRPSPAAAFVAFTTSLLFFLQLRIADELKDADEDARHRPYRPVPRGLVTLAELRRIGIGAAVVQAALALWLDASLLVLLVPTWLYLLLMTREFFAPSWLRAHPLAYIASHMLIVPLVDLYATACDWWVEGLRVPPAGLSWFLLVSFCNGLVIELGRKIRAPQDEEAGVETYTVLWGTRGAALAWLAALAAASCCALAAAGTLHVVRPIGVALSGLLGTCALTARRFADAPSASSGRSFEALSWVWTVAMYVMLGTVPLALQMGRSWR
jgi:4-hydroxybenzoate polyprenyltransferase